MTDTTSVDLLEARNICKSFYGNIVLDNISFSLKRKKVLGLLGQNGAGKSTLVKILTGAYQKDSGDFLIENEPADFTTIKEANDAGIALVFQELSLSLNMSVADNIFVNNWPTNEMGIVKKEELISKTQELLNNFDIQIDPNEKVSKLSNGERQIVEILKAVSKDPKILILDEPTSSLEKNEIDILFHFINELKQNNYSIIYISHHMNEIFEICDDVLVLRDGKKVLEKPIGATNMDELISEMVGHAQKREERRDKTKEISDHAVLEVKHLSNHLYYEDINFTLREGEVLGISGIVGSGKQRLCESLFGITHPDSGVIEIEGRPIKVTDPYTARENGILLIPENRKTEGLFLDNNVRNNMIVSVLDEVSNGWFLDNNKIQQVVEKYKDATKIKMNDDSDTIRYLSGGNQQKVLVSKVLAAKPKVLIAMDPTRGIDVTAKADIHDILYALSQEDLSILLISSEVDELITLSDRILVMNSGKLVREYQQDEFDENEITLAMHKSFDEVKEC